MCGTCRQVHTSCEVPCMTANARSHNPTMYEETIRILQKVAARYGQQGCPTALHPSTLRGQKALAMRALGRLGNGKARINEPLLA